MVDAKCFECGATYKLSDAGKGKARFEPHQVEVKCANPECKTSIFAWGSEIENGRGWKCKVCGGKNDIKLMIQHHPATAFEATNPAGGAHDPD
ncbi:hypothetical protein [Komagataeibacter europaeus]|uniref:hypothetical protein n=1 Tax=Komagataeibacter europaeus TaxID=33995 RepID=UPI000B3E4C4B|nr:hypothetical protein [Komagataeibacter europaeus]ARW18327.1 hypothetical protein S101446_03253 [Komagataeibacter europaeus]